MANTDPKYPIIETPPNAFDNVGKRKKKYPFDDLSIGQSFIIDKPDVNRATYITLCYRNSVDGKKFTVFTVPGNTRYIAIGRLK